MGITIILHQTTQDSMGIRWPKCGLLFPSRNYKVEQVIYT